VFYSRSEAPLLEPLSAAVAAQTQGWTGEVLERADHRPREEVWEPEISVSAGTQESRQVTSADWTTGA